MSDGTRRLIAHLARTHADPYIPEVHGDLDDAPALLAEVERLRAEVAARPPEAHVLRRAAAALEEDDFLGAAAEVLEMANAAEQAASDRRWAAAEQGEMGGAR